MLPLIMHSKGSYFAKVKSTSPLVYFPLNEVSGSTAINYGTLGTVANGTYIHAPTLGNPGIGDGKTSALFDGVNDWVDVLTNPLKAAFNGSAGSIMVWVKGDVSPYWWNTTGHSWFNFKVDAANIFSAWLANGVLNGGYLTTGGGSVWLETQQLSENSGFVPVIITWSVSTGLISMYINGHLIDTQAITAAIVGELTVAGWAMNNWFSKGKGYMAHCALWDRSLTTSEVLILSSPNKDIFRGLVLTFDDEFDGQYGFFQYAAPLGIKGTIYVTSDNIGAAGYMTAAQLQEADAAGWLIAVHSKDHTSFYGLSQADIETQITTCQGVLSGLEMTRGIYHGAYPFGAYNPSTAFPALVATGMLDFRGTHNLSSLDTRTRYKYCWGLSRYMASGDTLAQVQADINNAISEGGYYTQLIHDDSGVDGWSDANWQALCDWIVANGLTTVTPEDIWIS